MSRFLAYINKGTEADSHSSESVQAILQETTASEVSIKTFIHGGVQVVYAGRISIHWEESLGLLFILSGYFRCSGDAITYSDEAKDLVPLFDKNNEPLKYDFEGSFSLMVCHLDSSEVRLMTDRFGTRPLYFSSSERYMTVSSETFLLLPWVQKLSISPAALTNSFWLGFSRAPESMVSGIAKVDDNSVVTVSREGATERYVKPFPLVIEPDDTLDFDGVVTSIESALEDEFARIGETAERVAVLLSGGIDSSIMAAYAKKHFTDCVAFSCDIEGFHNPELERAVYVAEKLGLRHEVVRLNQSDLYGVFSEVVSMLEEPSRHINNIVVRQIFQKIQGFDAIIGGDGADALFGTRTNRTITNIEKKISLTRPVPDLLHTFILTILDRVNPGKRAYLERILTGDLESLLGHLFTIEYKEQDVSVAAKLGVSQFSGIEWNAYKSSDSVGKSLEANVSLYLRCMLERNSKLSNDSSIPIYYPFLTEAMLKISRQLPYHHRFDKEGNPKPALREICRRQVDSVVVDWPKIGFVTPENAWLKNELKPCLARVFANDGGITRVLGLELSSEDIAVVQSSTRLMWWMMTLDESLLAMEAKFLRWKRNDGAQASCSTSILGVNP